MLLRITTPILFTTLAASAAAQFADGQVLESIFLVNDLASTDVDGDGDIDLLAVTPGLDRVVWLENIGDGTLGTPQDIGTGLLGAGGVAAADLDGDGDMDVLAASEYDGAFSWFENLGSGTFGPRGVLSNAANGAAAIAGADLDGDGDGDVVGVSYYDDAVWTFENLGGGAFGLGSVISNAVDGPRAVELADLDADGRIDIVVASELDDEVSWFRNLGPGSFSGQRIITSGADGTRALAVGDVDGDGRKDVVCTAYAEDQVLLFRGLGGGNFGTQMILDVAADGARGVVVSDIDLDGDLDVACALYDGNDARWYENLGFGFFGPPQSLAPAGANAPMGAVDVAAFDLDGDTDVDIVSASSIDWEIAWYQNLIELGTTYCTSNPNSTGAVTSLAVSGSALASTNRLALTAADMPASAFGYFITSRTAGMVNHPGGSQGVLCIGGAIGRYVGPGQVQFSGAIRRIRLVLDLTRTPTPTGLVSATAGQSWHFQAWHRDSVLGSSTSNFSDAVRLTLQ